MVSASLYRPVSIGSLSLSGNLFLAPVSGWTDGAFRSICVQAGADFTFTELVSSEALCRGGVQTYRYLKRGPAGEKYAVQLFGADPVMMYRAALLLEPFHPEAIDINAGCPVPKVVKAGAGSSLMREPPLLHRIVASVLRASDEALGGIPVTVKMRLGWDADHINYRECATAAVEAGAAMVTLHPRTRAQGYGGKSDWMAIADLVTRATVPVAGSGDLFQAEDAAAMLADTGCSAVMFARGAQGQPWVFAQTKALLTGAPWEEPEPQQRLEAAMRHLQTLILEIGEKAACLEMRKQFCAYTHGTAGSASLRNSLVRASTIEEYRVIIRTYTQSL
jgi:nifR3 family TIM-barrel protein